MPALTVAITAKIFSSDTGIDCRQAANSSVAGTAWQSHKVGSGVSFASFTPYTFKKPDKTPPRAASQSGAPPGMAVSLVKGEW